MKNGTFLLDAVFSQRQNRVTKKPTVRSMLKTTVTLKSKYKYINQIKIFKKIKNITQRKTRSIYPTFV